MRLTASLTLIIASTLLTSLLTACAAQQSKPAASPKASATPALTLADKGQTKYVIALATGAIPAEQTAARELSAYLKQISGANFPVKDESQVADEQPQILVGTGNRVRKLLPAQKWSDLGADGIVLKTSGQNLVLTGSRPRGSLYAVYSFLEDKLGVRWWTPDESTVPTHSTLRVAKLDTIYTPQLSTREAFYVGPRTDPYFATQLKLNGNFQTQGPELGGHNSILGWCHTFAQLLPPEKYFKEHPEWYSDSTNGDKPCTVASPMPVGQAWQLCLSNDEARKELTKNALEWIRANPAAGTISISQNDTVTSHCMCPADMAREKAEGSPSGPLLHFVNQVAADIEKEYPDFMVETLAYNYTQKPPLHERPRRNVVIRLCAAVTDVSNPDKPILVDVTQPLNSASNAGFRDDVLHWKAIAPRLYIWNYVTNFSNYLIPNPNLHTTGTDIRFLTQNNAISLFEQGDPYNPTGDFTKLRVWLLAHLMWNPRLDQRQIEGEFLRGYYGAAAPHLRAYLDIIQKAGQGFRLSPYEKEYPYLTLDVMNAATRAFRKAELAVKNNPVLVHRVTGERLALDYAWIVRYSELHRDAEKRKIAFDGPQNLQNFVRDFVRNTKEFKMAAYSESTSFESYSSRLLARYGPRAPLPDAIKAGPDSDVLDIQDVSFLLYEQATLTSLVDDPKATDGKAAKFLGNSVIWGVQYPLSLEDDNFLKGGEWHCYIIVRVQPAAGAAKTGGAFAAGIYDSGTKKQLVQIEKSAGEAADDMYHVYDLGSHPLNQQAYFWIAPTNNPNVAALYIDRIVMVRDKK